MRYFLVSFLASIVLLFAGCAAHVPSPEMINKPVDLGAQRIALIQEYRCTHYHLCDDHDVTITPRMIVLHWTGTGSGQQAYALFKDPELTSRPDLQQYGLLNTGAQFLVARDGTVYELMPSNWMARHVIGLNYLAIGIENVGGVNGHADLTPAQITSDVYLVRLLKKQYPTIDYLIGHYEYTCFRNTPLFMEYAQNYMTVKKDPGPFFVNEVRKQVKNLGLKGCP